MRVPIKSLNINTISQIPLSPSPSGRLREIQVFFLPPPIPVPSPLEREKMDYLLCWESVMDVRLLWICVPIEFNLLSWMYVIIVLISTMRITTNHFISL